ncbi:TonB-dependent receptor plug domain-containing protein [Nitrosophilus alvini]|uniref:TonB-dependent receptor plug domain-containing protein n=1 Tax=Nitrosophilus alvini TaxID=2714855 RepID=UPI00190A3441|nr:TonB-dependent receptor [Nitrosophilus alvini]
MGEIVKKVICLGLIYTSVFSQNIENFLQDLEEATTLATRTKINLSDVPSVMSVYTYEEIKELGARNLLDLLSFVPGIEISIGSGGADIVIIRGTRVETKEKIKLMIDGVEVTDTFYGLIYYYLDFPAELIERVEIIRGPGSALYGTNAYMGVINVVTKASRHDKGALFFLQTGSYKNRSTGFVKRYIKDDFSAGLDFYFTREKKGLDSGRDALYGTYLEANSYSPGKTDEDKEGYSAGLFLRKGKISFNSRYKYYEHGNFYGFANILEGDYDRKSSHSILFSQMEYKDIINNYLDYSFKAGYRRYTIDVEYMLYPAGWYDIYSGYTYKNDVLAGAYFEEETFYADAMARSSFFDNHDIVFGAFLSYSHDIDSYKEYSAPFTEVYTKYTGEENFIKENIGRRVKAFYFQDIISAAKNLDISLGARADFYSDFGSSFNPRVSLVYRVDESNNIKALYQKAFRAPSWMELYSKKIPEIIGNENLDPEKTDTFEIGWVYKEGLSGRFNINFYYMEQIDSIELIENIYKNVEGKCIHKGIEAEYKKRYSSGITAIASYAFVDAEDEKGRALPDIAKHLAKGALIYRPSKRIGLSSVIKYVSERKRATDDTRDSLRGYVVFDQVVDWKFGEKSELVLSVKNLFDADVVYPAKKGTYMDDYHREGRTFYVKFIKNW